MITQIRHQLMWMAIFMGEWLSLPVPCQANSINIISLSREPFFLLLLGGALFGVAVGLRKNNVQKVKRLLTVKKWQVISPVLRATQRLQNFRGTNG